VDLQAIRTSLNTRTKSLLEVKKDTREHLHEEFGLMIQDEAQMTNTLKDTMRQGLTAKIAVVEAQAKCKRGTGTGT
jgi:signal transduction protein with GAF and PtsI domain